jgi:chloramphenicol-sensitive protein RarD
MEAQTPATNEHSRRKGLACALGAYLIWGLTPIYWKTLEEVPAVEILMHRIVWCFVCLLPIYLLAGHRAALQNLLRRGRVMGVLLASTGILGANWFLYIWAMTHTQVLQASLGYFITPLVNVLLGVVFLRERLRPLPALAVGLAAVGVLLLALQGGVFPWVALGLAFSFGFYGLIRKTAPVGTLLGLSVESALLGLPAAFCIGMLGAAGNGAFLHGSTGTDVLLLGAGPVTALPLLLFTAGARRLFLSTMGFLQYIAPSGTFLLAVFVFREPFSPVKLATFALIWAALAIFSLDSVRAYRQNASGVPVGRCPRFRSGRR